MMFIQKKVTAGEIKSYGKTGNIGSNLEPTTNWLQTDLLVFPTGGGDKHKRGETYFSTENILLF